MKNYNYKISGADNSKYEGWIIDIDPCGVEKERIKGAV